MPSLRNAWQLDEDVALSKDFRLGEKRSMEFRGSAFNIANRHLLGGINSTVGNSAFGQFTNPQSNLPRNVEFSLRFRLDLIRGPAASGYTIQARDFGALQCAPNRGTELQSYRSSIPFDVV